MLKSEVDGLYTLATTFQQVYTVYFITSTYTSNILVCLLCVTRYICIKHTFYHIKKKLLMGYIISFIVTVFTVWCYISFTLSGEFPIWYSAAQCMDARPYNSVRFLMGTVMFLYYFIQCLIAVIISLCTVYVLYKAKQSPNTSRANQLKGSFTILIMNFMNFIYPILFIVYQFVLQTGQLSWFSANFFAFISYDFIQLSMSALNPVIVVICSSGIRTMLRNWFHKLTNKPERAVLELQTLESRS